LAAQTANQDAIVRADSYVTLHYRLTILGGAAVACASGSVFMDSFNQRPATLQMGVGQWAPGLEACLLGRREGEAFSVTLPAEQAYGARNPDLLQWISHQVLRQHAAPDADLSPGDVVTFTSPERGQYTGVFKQLSEAGALFDFNHPLAGVDLQLDAHILGVL